MSSNNVDALFPRPSLHCNTSLHFTTLHYTYRHFTSSHLHFTTLSFQHFTTLHYTYRHFTSSHLQFTALSFQHFTTLIDTSHPLIYTSLPSHFNTSLHLSTLHILSFTLHHPLIWLNPSTFPIVLFHLTSLN